ncbi:hypothetical protein OGAPHI_005167 [Ogataea philodendri]|uniref:Uncharacterized protein n=1 Tax=Ogataea philodendri TaxID=1378263 RepID=A0A9P8P1V8_9ASCO|nr:uncharacterized protein OGAPHI_005167 [Ogataea philodendri]KAH3663765.1 hypothetical protein OGAPHI_005167 [Ogataea philodendri]
MRVSSRLESGNESLGGRLKLGQKVGRKLSLGLDSVQDLTLVGLQVRNELLLESGNLVKWDTVQVTVDTGVDDWNLLLSSKWRVLLLLQQLGQSLTSGQGLLGRGIKVRTELSESSNFSVLSQEQLQRTSNLLHGLNLGSRTDSRHRQTDVDSWSDTLVEQFSLQEDLTIGNGNDVGRNVSRDITTLGLNDWQSSQRTTSKSIGHLGSSLQQSRVQVENITWVSLSSWRSSQKKGQLTVSNGLLGQIVVDDQSVLSVVSEPLRDGTGSERSQVLQWSSLRSSGSNNDRVLQSIVLLQGLHQLSNGGSLLTNGNVNTVKFLGLVRTAVPSLLVQDGVKGNSSLTGLSVTNDQLSLTSSDWDKGIDSLQTSLHWLVNGSSWQDTWGLKLGSSETNGFDWSLTVNWVTQSVDDSSQHSWSDWNINNLSGSLNDFTLLDFSVGTEQHNTDLARLQVQGHTLDTGGELNQLFSLTVVQTENSGNTITDLVSNNFRAVRENREN